MKNGRIWLTLPLPLINMLKNSPSASAAVINGLALHYDLDPETLEKKRPPLTPGQMVVDDAALAPYGAYVATDRDGYVFLASAD